MSMIERVARALCMSDLIHIALGGEIGPNEIVYADANWPKYEGKARAVLSAMMEPSEAELEAAVVGMSGHGKEASPGDFRAGLQAMITAALSGE